MDQVRFSHLRAYGRSAMHGKLARTQERKVTEPMQAGTALHSLILGGKRVVGYPGAVRRGKEYDAFATDNADATILTMTAYNTIRPMADAVLASEVARPYLQGIHEQTILFQWLGLPCRATPDIRGSNFITEVKTTVSSEPGTFKWHALRMHYHAQMAMQQVAVWGCEMGVLPCHIIAVESKPPYPVTVFKFSERAIEAGHKLLMLWAERLKNCEASQQWPAYSQAVEELDLPEDDAGLVFDDEEEA